MVTVNGYFPSTIKTLRWDNKSLDILLHIRALVTQILTHFEVLHGVLYPEVHGNRL